MNTDHSIPDFFKSVYLQSTIAIEYFDLDGRLVNCNDACLRLFGIADIRQVIGHQLFDDPNLSSQQIQEIKDGKNVQYEIEFDFGLVKKFQLYETSKEGVFHLNCYIAPYTSESKQLLGYFLYIADITERKRAEAEIIKAKEKAEESERNLLIRNNEYEAINEELKQTNDELIKHREHLEEMVEERTVQLQAEIVRHKNAMDELKKKTTQLEAFNKSMIDREMRIIELKKRVNELCQLSGIENDFEEFWL